MAQRRVNVRFVGIALVVVVGVLGSLLLARAFLFRKDPHKYIQLAEDFRKNNDLVNAAINYKAAVDLNPKDLHTRVLYGDVLHDLARSDQAYMNQDRQAWDGVLTADPTNREALERMLKLEIEIVEYRPDARSFGRLHDVADRVLKLPLDGGKDDAERKSNADLKSSAKAFLHISVIAGWLKDIVTPDQIVDDNMEALSKLLSEEIALAGRDRSALNPDVAYYLGCAYAKRAKEFRTRGDQEATKDAAALERKAVALFEELLSNPLQNKNAVLRLRYAEILQLISRDLDDDMGADRKEYVRRMWEVLSLAREYVQPEDPSFSDVYVFYSQFLVRNGDPWEAEAVLRDLLDRKPDDQSGRLALAALLNRDPVKRAEAIDLLRKPITDPGTAGVLALHDKAESEFQTYVDLTSYLIEAYGSTADEAKRAEYSKLIDENYQKLVDRTSNVERPDWVIASLKLKGRIAMARGGVNGAIEAIPDLERAKEMWSQVHLDRRRRDWQLEYLLAQAYMESNQTGLAKQRLWEIVDGLPNYVPARILLTRLLINNQETDLAREQLERIKVLSPGDPEIDKLKTLISVFEARAKKLSPEEIEKSLATMPETTAAEIRQKASVCAVTRKVDEVIRLFEKLRAMDPADVDAVRTLVQIYMSPEQNKKDLAIKVADAALAKDPNNVSLEIVRAQIDKDEKRIVELTIKGIESIKDPFKREWSYYEFYNAQRESAEFQKAEAQAKHDDAKIAEFDGQAKDYKAQAMKRLDAAEKLAPETSKEYGRILDLRFGTALIEQKWDVAEKLITPLAIHNVDEAHGLIYRYKLAFVKRDLKGAEEIAREMVKTLPQYARSWLCYGDVLKERGQFEEAVAKYQMALEKQSENLEAFQGLILCNYALKKPDEMLRYINAGLKANPTNRWLNEQKVAWDISYGNAEQALTTRAETAKKNPESLGAQIAYGAAEWQAALGLAAKGKPADAKPHTDKAREVFTATIAKWPDERLAYAYLADIATTNNDFPAGEKVLKDLASRERYKTLPDASMLLGDYYARFGMAQEAETAYEDALAKLKLSKDTDAMTAMDVQRKVALFYKEQRKFDRAIKVLEPISTDRAVQQEMLAIQLTAGKLTEARELIDKQLAANPNDAQSLATKGFLLMQEKKPAEALTVLNQALQIEPRNQIALYYRGLMRLRQGSVGLEDAIKDLTAARDAADDTPGAMRAVSQIQTRLALAEALRAHNEVDASIIEMEKCVQLQPANKELRMKLIEMLGTLVSPRWGEVEQLINDAQKMQVFKGDPDWKRVEAMMWLTREKPEKAEASIKQGISMVMGQVERAKPLIQDYFGILAKQHKYRDLLNECNDLVNRPEFVNLYWVYQMRGVALAGIDGRRADAITDFDKALALTTATNNQDGMAIVIQTVADSIGIEEAIARCEREAAKVGDNHWLVIKAFLYFTKKDYAKAEAAIEKVLAEVNNLKTETERQTAYGVAGSIYMLTGEYAKAEAAYSTLLKMKPDDTVSLNNLACVWADYMEPADPAKALTYSGKAIEIIQQKMLQPDPNLLDTHGWALVCNNRVDEGIGFIQDAIDRSPRKPMPEAYYHLGQALLKKNLAPEAQAQLERAKKLMDDRKNKGQQTDLKMEARLMEALSKARQINGVTDTPSSPSPSPTTAPAAAGGGTSASVKP